MPIQPFWARATINDSFIFIHCITPPPDKGEAGRGLVDVVINLTLTLSLKRRGDLFTPPQVL
jgi:hypothetical protein